MKKLFLFTLVFAVAVGCGGGRRAKMIVDETMFSEAEIHEMMLRSGEHNARTSLDWGGTYFGVIPAANAPGIEVTLTLNNDHTYVLHAHYIDRPEADDLHSDGAFTWDETGMIVILSGQENGMGRFRVEEGRVRLLDMEGNVITGELADNYILKNLEKWMEQ